MTNTDHSHRVGLVTGAASGIGRQIALQLARQDGAAVYVVDQDEPGATRVAQEITASGGRAHAVTLDLSQIATLSQALSRLATVFGDPDIVVNNAGVVKTLAATDYPLDHWNTTLAVNLTAPMLLIQHAIPNMRAKGWGRIVNIASISGVRAGTGRLAYGTSKAALIAMTRQFAIETAEWGITVNAIAPGPIETPMVRSLQESGNQASYADLIPMRRYGSPTDIADSVAFLASERSSYITGHTLAVDGGFLASGVLLRNLFDSSAASAS